VYLFVKKSVYVKKQTNSPCCWGSWSAIALVTGALSRGLELSPGWLRVGFMVDEVLLGRSVLWVFFNCPLLITVWLLLCTSISPATEVCYGLEHKTHCHILCLPFVFFIFVPALGWPQGKDGWIVFDAHTSFVTLSVQLDIPLRHHYQCNLISP
jgi:hypothetical protein